MAEKVRVVFEGGAYDGESADIELEDDAPAYRAYFKDDEHDPPVWSELYLRGSNPSDNSTVMRDGAVVMQFIGAEPTD